MLPGSLPIWEGPESRVATWAGFDRSSRYIARHVVEDMRLVKSNGRMLTVRSVGPVEYDLVPVVPRCPLPIVLGEILSDDDARALLVRLRATGLYSRGSTVPGS